MTFSLDPDVRDLIFDDSNGHVGVIRTFLSHLIQTNKRTRDDVLTLPLVRFISPIWGVTEWLRPT